MIANKIYNYLREKKIRYTQDKIIKEYIKKENHKVVSLSKGDIRDISFFYKSLGYNIDTFYHEWYYYVTGIKDHRYLPDWLLYSRLQGVLNNKDYGKAWEDKAFFNVHINGAPIPCTIVKNINGRFFDSDFELLGEKEVELILSKYSNFIVKPAILSGGGKDVRVYNYNDFNTIKKQYGSNYVIQELIKQSDSVSVFNKSSVNTIRMISLFWENDIYICGQMLRIGNEGSVVDNVSHGQGYSVKIYNDGHVAENCFTGSGIKYNTFDRYQLAHSHKIEGVDKSISLIKSLHKKMPIFGLIAWDIAIDKFGEPIIIEYNINGIGIKSFQYNNGPIFGELTSDVLKYCNTSYL